MPSFPRPARPFGELPIFAGLLRGYRERVTARGRYLFWLMIALGVLGVDTRRSQVFTLFAVVTGLFLAAAVFAFLPRPLARIECRWPERATAGTPAHIKAWVWIESQHIVDDLHISFPLAYEQKKVISFQPPTAFFSPNPESPVVVSAEFQAHRRGRYLLRGPAVRSADPLHLALTRETTTPEHTLLVYPRFFFMEDFMAPAGRKYQPGGIPLASSTGDAIEFVGTREYREGDPVKNIHWRSWARRGEPVVKEYQEEYFCRIALILDTFLSPAPTRQAIRAFEAAISVLASIADFFSRSEHIVDILAAGPDIYQVSAGRSLAYLENVLDVLACLEPCSEPPFRAIGPYLFDKLAQITTVVAILLDWDEAREEFLHRVKTLGAAVRILVVHDGPTSRPWQTAGEDLGEIEQITPEDVERKLASTVKAEPASPGRGK